MGARSNLPSDLTMRSSAYVLKMARSFTLIDSMPSPFK